VELRFAGNPTIEDAEQFDRDAHTGIAATIRDTKGPVVICTDLRASHLFHPDVSERIVRTMRGETTNLQRNGLLGSGSAVLTLQLARLVKETTNDARRRVFTQPEPLFAWLDEVLTPAERLRLRQFLAELDPISLQPVGRPAPPEDASGAGATPSRNRPARPRPR
jgi:hypothetical protein